MRVGLLAAIFAGLLLLGASISVGEKVKFHTGEILYDTWGVPHIFADSFEALSYGFGYAQARDHGRLVTQILYISSGRAAELGGLLYTAVDRYIYSLRLKQAADEFYAAQSAESIVAFDNMARGFNDYAAEHPDEFTGPFAAILPINGLDIFRGNLRVLYHFAFTNSNSYSFNFREKYGENPLKEKRAEEGVFYSVDEDWDPYRFVDIPEELRDVLGSNGWALNSRSGRTDGKPKLVQNPHLPYFVFFRWYEAQLTCVPCGIDTYGAALVGLPNLQIAFNDYLGWTHTVNPHRPYTGYEIDLASDDSYYYDGQVLPITREEVTFRVKLPIGYRTETVINEFTHHGQIIARGEGKVLAKRMAGFDDKIRPDAVKQWWDMNRAKNLAEFQNAMRLLQVPMFYTIMTTRDDDIMLNHNGWIPKRQFGDYNYWGRAVNGSTSTTFWDTVHTWDELPTLVNPTSGFVQNANEPPWSATLPINTLDWNRYPPYMAPTPSMGYRPQISARTMSTNFNITFDRLVALKHTTTKEAASHALDDLLKAVETFGQSQDVFDAALVLASWDRKMEATSRGSDLFEEWLSVSPGNAQLFVNQWDPADPLDTPNTLANPAQAVADLETAVRNLRLRGIALDSQFGDNNRIFGSSFREPSLLPGNGCADCFRNSHFYFGLSGGGDSWVAVVEWDDTGAHAKCLIGYGNASPDSGGANRFGHVNDQNELFSRNQLRDVWRTRSEIEAHLEERIPINFS